MLQAQHETLVRTLRSDFEVAKEVMATSGGASLSQEVVGWDAVNQVSRQSQSLTLPKMMIGSQWLGKKQDVKDPAPVVDKVRAIVGNTCTIFQRMNAAGDMLRVCTNVENLDGSRAIGTYIPAVNTDGSPNPVVAAVMRGETYVGRAFVVKDWCLTAYAPIYDAKRAVIGAVYVGVKQENIPDVRRGISEIVVGKSGYVYVLGGSGEQRGKYIISEKGKRDGESIWEAKDADGRLFIQSLVGKAIAAPKGTCDFECYPWLDQGVLSLATNSRPLRTSSLGTG